MMNRVSKDDLLRLQKLAQELFPNRITKGKPNIGKIETIADKPFFTPFGIDKYETIYKKAACYMESIIRGHPFTDGNKRTAILTAHKFLESNGHYLVVPTDAVKYLVTIAEELRTNEDEIDDLIKGIADWLEARTSTTLIGYAEKVRKYVGEPWKELTCLLRKGKDIHGEGKMSDWLAANTHPEYNRDTKYIAEFYTKMIEMTTKAILRDKGHIDYSD